MKTLTGLMVLVSTMAFRIGPDKPVHQLHNGTMDEGKLPNVLAPTFRKDTLSIVKFGAVADGLTLNTSAITKAIDQCSRNGGGTVLIPTGLWVTGPIALKSNIN